MRVTLTLFDHTDWSEEKIEASNKKISSYLDKHKIEFGQDPSEIDTFLIEMSKQELMEFCTFLTENLKLPLNCMHIPYQTLCVNGNGDFEAISDEEAVEFIRFMWHKKIELFRP